MKELTEMTNQELLIAWEKGCSWLDDHFQVSGTDLDHSGNRYDHSMFIKGLRRIEAIEAEMQKRKMQYGKKD